MAEWRRYRASECATFLKVSDPFGGFSNMAGGMPLEVGPLKIPASESFYQAMRFPHLPEHQARIIEQASPLLSKRVAYERVEETREDWERVKVAVMRHALRLKFSANPERMRALYLASVGRPIVEISRRDDWWGAKPADPEAERLEGRNVLGRLHMELREIVLEHPAGEPFAVSAPRVPDYLLLGETVGDVTGGPAASQAALDL